MITSISLKELRDKVRRGRDIYYEQACEHGEMAGHEEQENRASGRVAMCDEILVYLDRVSLGRPPAATVTLRRPVIKRCPFVPETDAGTLTIVIPGEAPEIHNLDKVIDQLCAAPISHEDFTAAVADLLPAGAKVTTTWQTGSWDVEVTEAAR